MHNNEIAIKGIMRHNGNILFSRDPHAHVCACVIAHQTTWVQFLFKILGSYNLASFETFIDNLLNGEIKNLKFQFFWV